MLPKSGANAQALPELKPEEGRSGEYQVKRFVRRSSATNIRAISTKGIEAASPAPPSSHGRLLDEELTFDEASTLELDIPLAAPPSSRKVASPAIRPPAPEWPMTASAPGPSPAPRSPESKGGPIVAHDLASAVRAFAGFGDPPPTSLDAPSYALRVLVRRRTLQRDLDAAKRRRSPDVTLYEAAIASADARAFRVGLLLIVLATVGAFVVTAGVCAAVRSLVG